MQPLQHNYTEWFRDYPFEIMVTLSFKYENRSGDVVRLRANEFTRRVAKLLKTQVAGLVVFTQLRRSHLHLFLFGKSCSLENLTSNQANQFWDHGIADVSKRFSDGIYGYAGKNITPNDPDCYDLFPINKRVLKKKRLSRL